MKAPTGLDIHGATGKGQVSLTSYDHKELKEYGVTVEGSTTTCYALTSPGDVITVNFSFSPGVVDLADLVVDGILRSSNSTDKQSVPLKGTFKRVVYQGMGKAGRRFGSKHGLMQVKSRDTTQDIASEGSRTTSVGSLEIQVFQKQPDQGLATTEAEVQADKSNTASDGKAMTGSKSIKVDGAGRTPLPSSRAVAIRAPTFDEHAVWSDLPNSWNVSSDPPPPFEIDFIDNKPCPKAQKEKVLKKYSAEYKLWATFKFHLRSTADLTKLGFSDVPAYYAPAFVPKVSKSRRQKEGSIVQDSEEPDASIDSLFDDSEADLLKTPSLEAPGFEATAIKPQLALSDREMSKDAGIEVTEPSVVSSLNHEELSGSKLQETPLSGLAIELMDVPASDTLPTTFEDNITAKDTCRGAEAIAPARVETTLQEPVKSGLGIRLPNDDDFTTTIKSHRLSKDKNKPVVIKGLSAGPGVREYLKRTQGTDQSNQAMGTSGEIVGTIIVETASDLMITASKNVLSETNRHTQVDKADSVIVDVKANDSTIASKTDSSPLAPSDALVEPIPISDRPISISSQEDSTIVVTPVKARQYASTYGELPIPSWGPLTPPASALKPHPGRSDKENDGRFETFVKNLTPKDGVLVEKTSFIQDDQHKDATLANILINQGFSAASAHVAKLTEALPASTSSSETPETPTKATKLKDAVGKNIQRPRATTSKNTTQADKDMPSSCEDVTDKKTSTTKDGPPTKSKARRGSTITKPSASQTVQAESTPSRPSKTQARANNKRKADTQEDTNTTLPTKTQQPKKMTVAQASLKNNAFEQQKKAAVARLEAAEARKKQLIEDFDKAVLLQKELGEVRKMVDEAEEVEKANAEMEARIAALMQ